MPKGEKLTKKQKGFVKDYIKTGNGTIAAMNNYDVKDETVASSIATENLTKPLIQNAIKSIADRIPDELLERVHLEGLEASDKLIKDGEVIAEKPDYAVRHKYLDSAYKLKGIYAPDKSVNLNLNGDIIADEELEKLARQINAISTNNTRTNINETEKDL